MYVCMYLGSVPCNHVYALQKKKIVFSRREEKMNAISQGSEVKKRERENMCETCMCVCSY